MESRHMTRSVFLKLKRLGEPPRCCKCGRILQIGNLFYTTARHSHYKRYCPICYEFIHLDVEDDSNPQYRWLYDKEKDVWLLTPIP